MERKKEPSLLVLSGGLVLLCPCGQAMSPPEKQANLRIEVGESIILFGVCTSCKSRLTASVTLDASLPAGSDGTRPHELPRDVELN